MNNRDIILTKLATQEPLTGDEQAELVFLKQDASFVTELEETTAVFSQFNAAVSQDCLTPSVKVMGAVMAEAADQIQNRSRWGRPGVWASAAAAVILVVFLGYSAFSSSSSDDIEWVSVGEKQTTRQNSIDVVAPLQRIKPPTSLSPVNTIGTGSEVASAPGVSTLTDDEFDKAFDDLSLIFEDDLILFHTVASSTKTSNSEIDVDSALDELEQLF